MKLLGALGFDWKIFIIQSINFVVLFFILEKLFFKPFIKAVKNEKNKEDEIKKDRMLINKEKEEWEKEKYRKAKEFENKINEALLNVNSAVNRIKNKINKEELAEEKSAINYIKKQSGAIIEKYKENFVKSYKENTYKEMVELFNNNISNSIKEKINNEFWFDFIKKLENIDIKNIEIYREKSDEELKKMYPEYARKIIERNKKTEDKIININVLSPYKIKKYQLNFIKNIFNEKLKNKKFKIKAHIDKSLIAGYSLEIKGILIEKNLKNELESIFTN